MGGSRGCCVAVAVALSTRVTAAADWACNARCCQEVRVQNSDFICSGIGKARSAGQPLRAEALRQRGSSSSQWTQDRAMAVDFIAVSTVM
jgi:hypothetical protein